MQVRFVMDTHPLTVHASDPWLAVAWRAQNHPHDLLCVVDGDGRFLGVLPRTPFTGVPSVQAVETLMRPRGEVVTVTPETDLDEVRRIFETLPKEQAIAVVQEDRLVGVVRLAALTRLGPPAMEEPDIAGNTLFEHLLEAMLTGVFVVDLSGTVRLLNPAGAEILDVCAEEVVGRPYEELAQWIFPNMEEYLRFSAIPEMLSGGRETGERRVRLVNGRHALFRFSPIREGAREVGVVVIFMDVSAFVQAEEHAAANAEEAEMAFALTLPNSKVERKLKSSPEYRDVYDAESGIAKVVEIIPDGTYRHVVNGLRIMAELHNLGVFLLVGMDKDTMVDAFIFHDVGKEQPVLEPGESFVPRETFEPGHLHAFRSAEWAAKYYRIDPDAEWLIRYHHTPESDLPSDFPPALMPMLRLFKLVDGLSAAITRRRAVIRPILLQDSSLEIFEENSDPRYHQHYRLALYSGMITPLDTGSSRRSAAKDATQRPPQPPQSPAPLQTP